MPDYQITVKRVYDEIDKKDGARLLTDRVWPRGIKKADLQLSDWFPDVCPETSLRKAWHQGLIDYHQFCQQYRQQLCQHPAVLLPIMKAVRQGPVTLLTAVKTPQRSHIPVLKSAILEALSNEDKANNDSQSQSPVCYGD
ncbi:MAG: DUF488 family protein [Methylophaga sp.]